MEIELGSDGKDSCVKICQYGEPGCCTRIGVGGPTSNERRSSHHVEIIA